MKHIEDIFSCWETIPAMAQDTGIEVWTLRKCKQRKSIAHGHWGTVIDALRRKGKDLTVEQLLAMHSSRLPRRPSSSRVAR